MKKPLIILITGCTSGIGRATALWLAQHGHHVIASGRQITVLNDLKTAAGSHQLDILPLDVCDAFSINTCLQQVMQLTQNYGIDILINNAGYSIPGPMELLSDSDLKAVFAVNVFGLMAVTRAFLPAMRARGSGRIINISSIVGRITFPIEGAYSASKYAVESLSDALRLELKPFNIDVVLIEPGPIQTQFEPRAENQLNKYKENDSVYGNMMANFTGLRSNVFGKAPDANAVAKIITKAITAHSPRSRYLVPFQARLLMALCTWLPTIIVDSLKRFAFGVKK